MTDNKSGKKKSYSLDEYEEAVRLANRIGIRKAARLLSIPASTLHTWVRGLRKPPVARWQPAPARELAYILGVLLGDGYVREKKNAKYVIMLTVKDYELADEFSRCLASVLNKKPRKPRRLRSGYWRVEYYSKSFYCWYKTLLEDLSGNLRKYIEECGDKECIRAFLRGIFDAEGSHIYYRHRYESIRLVNSSIVLLRYVQHLLSHYFSIPSRIYYTSRDKCYVLAINRQHFVQKFLSAIGFTIQRKQYRKQLLVNDNPGP